jgi:hypothetical protein
MPNDLKTDIDAHLAAEEQKAKGWIAAHIALLAAFIAVALACLVIGYEIGTPHMH